MKRLLFILFFASGFNLIAQELDDTVKIPRVDIEATRINPSIQRLDSAHLQDPINFNLSDALHRQSSVFIKSYGIGGLATPSIRGSGASHAQVYWNGLQLNASTTGVTDLSLFPGLFVDAVKLNYGLAGLEYGSGTIGGAIVIENKVDFQKKIAIQLGQTFGSFGRKTSALKMQFGKDKLQFVSRILWRQADNDFSYKDMTLEGFPTRTLQNANLEQKGFMQSVHYRWKNNQMIEGHVWWYESDRNLPALMTLGTNREKQIDESAKAIVKYRRYGEDWQLNYMISGLDDRLIYKNERASILDTTDTKSFLNQIEFRKQWTEKLKSISKLNLNIQEAKTRQFIKPQQRKTFSIYNDIDLALTSRISANLAVRNDLIFDETELFMPAFTINYLAGKNKAWLIYGKLGRNWKYPSLNDLYTLPFGNSNLKAEESKSVEAGLAWRKKSSVLDWNNQLNIFTTDIDNYIQWQPNAFGFWEAKNLEKVKTKGLEIQSSIEQENVTLNKKLSVIYTYTKSENQEKAHAFDESDGKQLIYIPENQLNLQLDLKFKRLKWAYHYNFIGERYTSTDNERSIPSYATSDMSMSGDFKMGKQALEWTLSLLNIYDVNYQAIEWRPMSGRSYMIKVIYRIDK